MSEKARFKKFEPLIDCDEPYPIQKVQDLYRVTEDFNEALMDLELYGHGILKPITTTFNFEKKVVEYDRNIECVAMEDSGPKF